MHDAENVFFASGAFDFDDGYLCMDGALRLAGRCVVVSCVFSYTVCVSAVSCHNDTPLSFHHAAYYYFMVFLASFTPSAYCASHDGVSFVPGVVDGPFDTGPCPDQ